MKSLGQHTDDLPRLSINRNRSSQDRRGAAKPRLPVFIGKHHGRRRAGRIILAREEASDHWSNAQGRQRAIGYIQPAHMFRFARAGYAKRIAVIGTDVLHRGVLLAIDKVNRRRHVQFLDADSWRGVPHADQCCSGWEYGKGFRRTPSTTLKMMVFAPMPTASVSRVIVVKSGARPSLRRTCLN